MSDNIDIDDLFHNLGGDLAWFHPHIHVPVYHNDAQVPYLKKPGVVMISIPSPQLEGVQQFLDGFDPDLGFSDYLDDDLSLEEGEELTKFAGQLCYMSFGPKRTKNADAKRYFDNIKASSHGSVCEHANYSFLLYGISRSVTHEIVRHRAGFAFSQLSQRYVSGASLRFVERPEYANDEFLHTSFLERITEAALQYRSLADYLHQQQKAGAEILSAEAKTDLRKKVQQASRSVLPNETEAPMVMTGNVRAWRHFIEMRASEHAEIEIRELALRIFLCLYVQEPLLFGDYEVKKLNDGTYSVDTEYRKV
jgi:thymidylate synthase (FAD)